MARAHKQRILIAVIALCLATIVIYAIFSGSNQFSLTVGGRKITKDELSFFFDQEKNATYTYYSSTYGVTNFDGPFWKTEFDGKTPLKYAQERALTKCYEQNLQMLLAEKMLSQESSFQAIQNAYTEYISSRNSAKDTTAIYYGPSELEFRDFYNYFLSNQKNAVLAAMRTNGTVTENEVSLYYTKMRGLLYSIDPAYEFMVISFDEIAEKSDQSSEIEAVRTEVLNGTKVEDLDIKHEGIRIEEYTLNGHSGMGIQATAAPYISSIEKLHDGEISDVLFNSRNGFYLIYMNARKEGRILEYDEVHNRIEASLLEHAYETELANIREETPMIVS